MQDLDHPVRRGARLSAVPVDDGGHMTPRDEPSPALSAHRLLDLATALSEGASRMHDRLRHLDPRDRDEVLDLVTGQVSEIVRLWADLVRNAAPGDDGEPLAARNGAPRPAPGPVDETPGDDDHSGDHGEAASRIAADEGEPPWREPGSEAHERWEAAYGPEGARRDTARDEMERQTRDELTGVLNRQAGLAALGREVDRCQRSSERMVLGFLNVDRLKAFNEARGARTGDELLRKVASALRATLRSYDVVVRLGGDEFLFSLPGADMATAELRYNEFGVLLGEEAPGATASVGFAELRDHDTLDDLISRADVALVKGRRSRRRAH
jgi:diguanylate cyclase (GGDEF)-like protein